MLPDCRSSKKLEDTHRIVAETEEVGIAVLDTLAQQRESLLGAHEKVGSYPPRRICHLQGSASIAKWFLVMSPVGSRDGAMTTEARRILQRMTRRIITNTIVLYTTIFVLIVAICYVLYADFIKATRFF